MLLLFALLQHSAASAQQAPAIKTSYLIDKNGDFSVNAVEKMSFIPMQIPFSRGYTPTVTWIKIELAESDVPYLVLSMQPTFLDNVRLYRYTPENGWQPEQMGDHFPFNQRIRKERVFSFNITPHTSHPSFFFVRIQSTSASLFDIQVRTEDETIKYEIIEHGFIGLYVGFILILITISAWRFVFNKSKMWGISLTYQIVTLCVAIGNTGFVAKYIFPNAPHIADGWVSINVILQASFGSLFMYFIVKKYHPYRWVLWMLLFTSFIIPIASIIKVVMGEVQEAMLITVITHFISPSFITIGVYLLKIDDRITRNLLRGTCLILSSYLLYFLMGFIGLGTTNIFHIYPPLIFNLLVAVLNTLILVRNEHLEKEEIYGEIEKAKEIRNEFIKEKSMRMAESSLLSMLIHEIKNPMATIRLATRMLTNGHMGDTQRKHERIHSIEKATSDIDNILERTISIDELDNKSIHINPHKCDISFLIYEIVEECPMPSRISVNLSSDIDGYIDGKILNMMIKNLINNALSYSCSSSIVFIDVAFNDVGEKEMVFRISNVVDDGCLPDPNLIFTKYYRSDYARRSSGTGLGLYWVNGVASIMGGKLSYRSNENNVIFELVVPC